MGITVDLNADLGEFDTNTNLALPGKVTSASISCGVHAGDPLLTLRTIKNCNRYGVTVGAHPSYPDRENFGRKSMWQGTPVISATELRAVLGVQLATFASLNGGKIAYVKPHGALYNDAQQSPDVAEFVAHEASRYHAAIMGQPGSQMQEAANAYGLTFIAEVFADRGYEHNGTLIRRGLPHSVHTNPSAIAGRVVQMVTQKTVTTWGYDSETRDNATGTFTFAAVDSVCLHGDGPRAYEIAGAVRQALRAAGVTLASPLAVTAS